MTLWILGAEGLLGKALLELCAKRGIEATGTSKSDADITNPEMLDVKADEIGASHIVNCAAYTNVDGAQSETEQAYRVNALGAQYVAAVAAAHKARLIHISTDFVFDGARMAPYEETDQAHPINAYGESKWEGERQVLAICPDACIIRTSWLFGEGGKNFFSSLLKRLKNSSKISAAHDQWGRLTYAPDLAHAILILLNQQGIFHFANEERASCFDIVQFAFEEMRQRSIPMACHSVLASTRESFPLIAPRPVHSVLSTEKYTRMTSERPRSWKEALREYICRENA